MLSKIPLSIWLRSLLAPVVLMALTLLLAGRIDYWQGWLYNGTNAVVLAVTIVVLRNREDLIMERLKPGPGMKSWDKVYYLVSSPIFFLTFILSVLDGGRFGWSRLPVSTAVVAAAFAVYALGQGAVLWAKRVNSFFSSVVRIQSERGQVVCRSGPYRFVRHPGYLGGLIFNLATPLMLGSWWGLVPAALVIVPVVIRTALEDRMLHLELPGYAEYARTVRFRLVPGVW